MRKIIVTLFFLISTNVYSQQILGLGEILIGMNNENFLSLDAIKVKSIIEKVRFNDKPKNNEIIRATSNTKLEPNMIGNNKIEPPIYSRIFSADVIKYEFLLPLGIPDILGRDQYEIEVIFYKNKITKINVLNANGAFRAILAKKYGAPEIKDDSKIEICQNANGIKSEHSTGFEYNFWGGKENFRASYVSGSWNCGTRALMQYSVYNISNELDMFNAQQEGQKKYTADQVKANSDKSKL